VISRLARLDKPRDSLRNLYGKKPGKASLLKRQGKLQHELPAAREERFTGKAEKEVDKIKRSAPPSRRGSRPASGSKEETKAEPAYLEVASKRNLPAEKRGNVCIPTAQKTYRKGALEHITGQGNCSILGLRGCIPLSGRNGEPRVLRRVKGGKIKGKHCENIWNRNV